MRCAHHSAVLTPSNYYCDSLNETISRLIDLNNIIAEETAQGISGKLPSPTDDEIAAQIHSRRFRE